MDSFCVQENLFLLYSLIMGIYITFFYDLLRIIRRVIPHNSFFISMEDLGFWFYCAMKIFYLMHTQGNGTMRWFAILGAMTGMFIYRKTLSQYFVKWMSLLLRNVLIVIYKPFQFLGKKTGKIFRKAAFPLKRKLCAGKAHFKNKLTREWKLLKISIKKQ